MSSTEFGVYTCNGAALTRVATFTIDDSVLVPEQAAVLGLQLASYADRETLTAGDTLAVLETAVGG